MAFFYQRFYLSNNLRNEVGGLCELVHARNAKLFIVIIESLFETVGHRVPGGFLVDSTLNYLVINVGDVL